MAAARATLPDLQCHAPPRDQQPGSGWPTRGPQPPLAAGSRSAHRAQSSPRDLQSGPLPTSRPKWPAAQLRGHQVSAPTSPAALATRPPAAPSPAPWIWPPPPAWPGVAHALRLRPDSAGAKRGTALCTNSQHDVPQPKRGGPHSLRHPRISVGCRQERELTRSASPSAMFLGLIV
ncbi:hypothetical protein NDU88_004814 [Pleurodeles waltl]|uniref:Uncharacterized protein n=1 Tax=Pleurodeles waltl TaxID=8319 RepID=A0AAV7MWI0_PLEWA|nr:hypothetical protein NDU88_004814 [Pleurodeles waltl]